MKKRLPALFLLSSVVAAPVFAEIPGDKVRIGVLTNLSGVFETSAGKGSVEAVRMAVEDFGGTVNGKPVEVIAGDHQNKPDIGASLANRWFDVDRVDMIADVVNSAVAFAVVEVARQRGKTVLITASGSDDLTGKACAPDTSAQWVYDSYEVAASVGASAPVLGKTWYLFNTDFAFGVALENGERQALAQNGATVAGALRHPLGTSDYSSFVLQARAAKADVIAFAPSDQIAAFRSLREYDVPASIMGLGLDRPTDVKALELDVVGGAYNATAWMQRDDGETKAWVARFIARRGVAPGAFQVGAYSATLSWLKAVQATNSTDSRVVLAKIRETPIRDVFTDDGYLREDGRMVHSVALVQMKTPAESTGEWDFTKLVRTFKGDDVFRPLKDGGCPALAGR